MQVTGFGRWLDEALEKVFVTEDNVDEQLAYVKEWVGKPCNCPDKRLKINMLWRWAQRVNSGKTADAKKYLEEMLGDV